jgi:hypothetical protein
MMFRGEDVAVFFEKETKHLLMNLKYVVFKVFRPSLKGKKKLDLIGLML